MILVRLVVRHVVSCMVMISGGVGGGAVPCHSVGRGLDEGLVGIRPRRSPADDSSSYRYLPHMSDDPCSEPNGWRTEEMLSLDQCKDWYS